MKTREELEQMIKDSKLTSKQQLRNYVLSLDLYDEYDLLKGDTLTEKIDNLTHLLYNPIQERAKQYDEKNPHIWVEFEKLAFEAIKKGFKNFGSKSIF